MGMRVAVLGAFVGAGLLVALVGGRVGHSQVSAQRFPGQHAGDFAPSAALMVLNSDVAQSHQQVTLIDPKARVMSVYHIDRATGEISLKSVRNVHWDLQMDEFNGTSPSPREIRSLLEQR